MPFAQPHPLRLALILSELRERKGKTALSLQVYVRIFQVLRTGEGFLWHLKAGGQRGIRTLETVARLHAFQACAFDHSAICPHYWSWCLIQRVGEVKRTPI